MRKLRFLAAAVAVAISGFAFQPGQSAQAEGVCEKSPTCQTACEPACPNCPECVTCPLGCPPCPACPLCPDCP